MIILTIRTDKPESEIGLFDNEKELAYEAWQAHRQLAETLHKRIEALITSQKIEWNTIEGVVVFQGPGSFTGLRIGISVANALAYSNKLPIVGAEGENWQQEGIKKLMSGMSDNIVMPHYGAEANITAPKK